MRIVDHNIRSYKICISREIMEVREFAPQRESMGEFHSLLKT